jgi:hypothetical protein
VDVPANPKIYIRFDEQLDRTMLPASAVALDGGITGTVAFDGSDYSTLVFTPSSALSSGTTYHISVAGLRDLSGNPMAPFAGSSFTTAASATQDTRHGNITSSPTGSNVPVNTQIVWQLSKPVNPISVDSSSFRVYDNTSGADVPGSLSISADCRTITFTPAGNFASAHRINVYNGNPDYITDLAGNNFNYLS